MGLLGEPAFYIPKSLNQVRAYKCSTTRKTQEENLLQVLSVEQEISHRPNLKKFLTF